ncbi:MAG TPA: hypothetical protein VGH74_13450 [Planctomycetaceae bacterium]|jgi:hypothetical protein
MNRKLAKISGGVLCSLALVAGGLALSLRHQPAFYRSALAENVPPETRREQAKAFVQTTLRLVDDIRYDDRWSDEFSEDAVNGWLAEELPTKYRDWLPPDVSQPRVKFENGVVLLAFQARRGMWQGVVSSRIRPWVSGANQLALEIQSARLGLIPVPVEEIVDDLVKNLSSSGWRTQWKNTGKQDVLVVDLDSVEDSAGGRDHAILESVELGPKLLRISGRRSTEIAAPAAADRISSAAAEPDAR